jgi:hypothetical protein
MANGMPPKSALKPSPPPPANVPVDQGVSAKLYKDK